MRFYPLLAALVCCAPASAPDVDASSLPTEPAIDAGVTDAAEGSRPSDPTCDREEVVSLDGGRSARIELPCRPYDPVRDAPDPPF
jgi:hypothetical protein